MPVKKKAKKKAKKTSSGPAMTIQVFPDKVLVKNKKGKMKPSGGGCGTTTVLDYFITVTC